MSKPHLAIQNQAVKYAEKDIDGKDINQYDYISVDLDLLIEGDTEYELVFYGLYMDIKNNYKKLPTSEINITNILDWLAPLVRVQCYPIYILINGATTERAPVKIYYDTERKLLSVYHLNGSNILANIEMDKIEIDSGTVIVNPLTDNKIIFEM